MNNIINPSRAANTSLLLVSGLTLIISAFLLAGCASAPEKNAALARARSAYEQARANPEIAKIAPVSMHEASQALKKAEQAKDSDEIEHLAYIAERRSRIAVAEAEQKIAQKAEEELIRQKESIVREAREFESRASEDITVAKAQEADRLKQEAEAKLREIQMAKVEAESLAVQAEKARQEAESKASELEQAREKARAKALEADHARKEADAKARELEMAKKAAEAKRLEAESARAKAEKAVDAPKQLENELLALKARQEDRGVVLTLGYILFETKKAELMSGAMRTIDTLAEFLKKNPKRNVLVEGFTDSSGSEAFNLELSQMRADAVRNALTEKGIAAERITAKGYGIQFPVAGNETEAGRQQNRRVEIIILDEGVSAETMLR